MESQAKELPVEEGAPPPFDFSRPVREKKLAVEEGAPPRLEIPGMSKPDVEKDWGKADFLTEVLPAAVRNAPQSALHQLTAIPEAIYHYDRTAEGMKMLGRGLMSKTGIGGSDDPEQRAKDEAVVSGMVAPFTSWAGFKKSLATDPFESLSILAIPLSGGASGLGKVGTALASTGTTAGKYAGKIVSGAGKLTELSSNIADPIKGSINTAGFLTSNLGKPALQTSAEALSGVNKPTMEAAYKAGAGTDPAIAAGKFTRDEIKDAFNNYTIGRGDPIEFSQIASKALEAFRKENYAKFASNRDNLASIDKVVDLTPAYEAIYNAKKDILPGPLGFGKEAQNAHTILDDAIMGLDRIKSMPPEMQAQTVKGIDLLKRDLWKEVKAASGSKQDAYKSVWAGVRDSLSKTAPEYDHLMDLSRAAQDAEQSIQKTLGLGNRVAANAEIAKQIKEFGDAFGVKEIEKLAQYDARIPYMVAGASLHAAAGHPGKWSETARLGHAANIGTALLSGDIPRMLASVAALGAHATIKNPKVVGAVPFYAGEVAGSLPGRAAGAVAEGAGAARRIITPPLMQLQNTQTDINGEDEDNKFLTIRPGRDFRTGRASGGRTIGHDEISDRLVRMADQVRKQVSTHTEKLLDTPDDHIAKALEIANRDI